MGTKRRIGQNIRLIRHNRSVWESDLDAWTAHMRAAGAAASTVRLRRAHLERALTWIDAPSPWQVTLEQLTAYLAAHDWAPESRKSVRSSLRAFYAWGELVGRTDDDPSRKLPRVAVPAGTPRPAPTDVYEHALAGASTRERRMVLLAGLAGLRRAEIAGLHSSDIVAGAIRVHGKGGKVREVPLHPLLAEELAGIDGYVFPGNDNGHLSPDRVGRIMAKLLGSGWTAHTLRHRFATRAYASERDLLSVQQLLGHSSPATTQRYTQVPDDAKRRAVLSVA